MRILVVEDDVQLAEMLTEALTERQYVVDVAKDGEAAWNWVEALEYDLIVLDVTLPKLDGVSFCQRLRDRNSSLPVLKLRAVGAPEDVIETVHGLGYRLKPIP
jgi:DNA-binding response OmpR family regulator